MHGFIDHRECFYSYVMHAPVADDVGSAVRCH
jgi:hypothetical protein